MANTTINQRSRVEEQARDQRLLNEALRHLLPSVKPSTDRAWSREPALRVIDCVLSLNRNYDRFVVPRLDAFEGKYPGVLSINDLKAAIAGHKTPHQFMTEALSYRHEARAEALSSVVKWLSTVAGDGTDSKTRLELWAKDAKPTEAKSLAIPGFGLAGFQYLRMLFGGNTVKPDLHICQYVSACVHRRVSATEALKLLEAAAIEIGLHLRDMDTTIWESSARRSIARRGGVLPEGRSPNPFPFGTQVRNEPTPARSNHSGQTTDRSDGNTRVFSFEIDDDTHLELGELTADDRRAVEKFLKDSLKGYLGQRH